MVNKILLGLTFLLIVLILVSGGYLLIRQKNSPEEQQNASGQSNSEAINAGKQLSYNKCEGQGSTALTHLPMNMRDVSEVQPYGLMVGAHVTPIDHWYFGPKDQQSARNAYPVFAPADGTIVDIQKRVQNVSGQAQNSEYRIVFMYTCTFYSYYDLVTELSPEIISKTGNLETKNSFSGRIQVKSGQEIGRIGGQTLDFAVWDTEKPLGGFINPDSYKREPWKIYTANPFNYFSTDVSEAIKTKYLRIAEPIEGKIDYDIEGKLVGNWFEEGTNGYEGIDTYSYWSGHLAIVYDYLDPSAIMISIGNYQNTEKVFAVKGNLPDPKTIGIEEGMIKYELVNYSYTKPDGTDYRVGESIVKGPKVKAQPDVMGTIAFQLTQTNELKVEIFPGKTATQVEGFTSAAKTYVR